MTLSVSGRMESLLHLKMGERWRTQAAHLGRTLLRETGFASNPSSGGARREMTAEVHPVVVEITRIRLWLLRAPQLFIVGVGGYGVLIGLLWPTVVEFSAPAYFASISILVLAGAMSALKTNRIGVRAQGLAPSTRPLRSVGVVWIIPWSAVERVCVLTSGIRPSGKSLRLRIRIKENAAKTDWEFTSLDVLFWFGRGRAAERFVAWLTLVGQAIEDEGRPLTFREIESLLRQLPASPT